MGTGLGTVRNLVWGAPMLALILLCGAVCTVRLRFVQFRRLPDALRAGLGGGAHPARGGVSPLAATATALLLARSPRRELRPAALCDRIGKRRPGRAARRRTP